MFSHEIDETEGRRYDAYGTYQCGGEDEDFVAGGGEVVAAGGADVGAEGEDGGGGRILFTEVEELGVEEGGLGGGTAGAGDLEEYGDGIFGFEGALEGGRVVLQVERLGTSEFGTFAAGNVAAHTDKDCLGSFVVIHLLLVVRKAGVNAASEDRSEESIF